MQGKWHAPQQAGDGVWAQGTSTSTSRAGGPAGAGAGAGAGPGGQARPRVLLELTPWEAVLSAPLFKYLP